MKRKIPIFAVLLAGLVLSISAVFASTEDVKRASELFQLSIRNYNNPSKRDEALQQITEAIRLNPNNATLHFHKATVLAVSEEEDTEALQHLDKALALEPKHGPAWDLKANLLLRNKKPLLALPCADKAVAYGTYHYRLTRMKILQRLGRFSEALKEADQCLQKYPDNLFLLSIHSDLSQRLKHWQAVIDDQTKLLKISHPGTSHVSHLKARAKAYMETHNEEKALLDLEAAAKRTTLDRQVHSDLLAIYKRKKDLKNIAKEEAYIKRMDEDLSP